MNTAIERVVAEHRAAVGRRLGDLEEVRRFRQLPAPRLPSRPGGHEEPHDEEPYRPKSWLI